MAHNHLTIADIQTVELVYHDPEFFEECYRFCEKRDIDCLPEIENPNSYHERVVENKRFQKQPITDDRKLDGSTFLFQSDLLDRFQKHAVQFVFSNGIITGVVHFSDYNKDAVSTYLFRQIIQYERDLRKLLALHGLTNDHMKDHFLAMANKEGLKQDIRDGFLKKASDYEGEREELERQEKFITFYLKDLIGLAHREKIMKLNEEVNKLRNVIMHAGPLVKMEDASTPDYIYTIDSFDWFFKTVLILLKDGRRINNRLLIKQELSLERSGSQSST